MSALDLSGTQVAYLDQGSGEPVVLLHSSASSGAQWRALMGQLGERYRVIAPDLYGYGGTASWAGCGSFGLEHEAQIVYALLGRAGEPVHLVGHSFGGAVALHVARTRPDLLASLTVIEPVAFHLLRGDEAFDEIATVAADVVKALASGDFFGGIARFVDYWSGPGAWAGIPAEKRPGLASRLGKVALDFHAAFSEPASIQDFCALALPTLVVQGACSPLPTRRICELLAAVLPDAHLTKIEGAGHMAPLTHRDSVNALIEAHLERNSGLLSRYRAPAVAVSGAAGPGAAYRVA
jgi:pimeloyl-ACP methyl ester carboxylesterase